MKKHILLLIVSSLLFGCVSNTTKVKPHVIPTNLAKQGGLEKSYVDVVMYFSKSALESEITNRAQRVVLVGQAMKQAFNDVGQTFVNNLEIVDSAKSEAAGLFGAMSRTWSSKDGLLTLTIDYSIFDGNYDLVLEGSVSHTEKHNYNFTEILYYNLSVRAAQKVFIDLNKQLKPTHDIYPSTNTINNISVRKLANLKKPYSQTSAIALSENGYILGVDSDLEKCLIIEGVQNKQKVEVSFIDKSQLLDVALLQSNTPLQHYTAFGDIKNNQLGDALVSVSYNFKGATPAEVLSFSNLSSNTGVTGSLKSHFVSSAITPASSLAGFYDKNGYLVGFFNGSLNYPWLLKRESIQANTYQFMEASPLLKFLDKHDVKYTKKFKDNEKHTALEEAKNNLLYINCYQ